MEKPSIHVIKEEKRITFKVQKQRDEDMYLTTHRNVPLGKVLRDYCEKRGLIYEYIRFTHDGRRVKGDKTPNDLEMEDDDVIDTWNEQLGGSGSLNGDFNLLYVDAEGVAETYIFGLSSI